MLTRLQRLASETLHENPWWQYRHDRYTHPDGSEGDFFYAHTRGAVFVIPEYDDGRVLMLRQFRYLNQRESLEFVGGGIKEGLTREVSAREELLEESGLLADRLIPLGWFNPMNGLSDEECYVFLATGLHSNSAHPEVSEEFEPVLLTLPEIDRQISSGEIWDGMTLAAYSLYRFR
ncbi:MAG: NUDIX hydrolase [Bacteroidota bacterium]|nr:NUDIX hydrolase [Bacteroidota bacterium]MDP4233766.1 NUDIX hydrolase [Bacteroidota bacterium]MDP4242405.1 NUDIX hydrolase [Bacteroidota bacterium]MDP4287527.1 NUDIX hydrolase [Bacteroidota bacterium]